MSGGVWMALEGVLMMSRWCLRVSGEASIHNMLAKTMLSYCYIFFQCPVLHKNVFCLGVSVLCLRVSGLGLMASGYVLIPNRLVKMYSHAKSNKPLSSCGS